MAVAVLYSDSNSGSDNDNDSDVTVKRKDMVVGFDLQGKNWLGVMIVRQARTCLNNLITTYFQGATLLSIPGIHCSLS